jgi:16S rRNA (cytosine967-C5)-methyltransferase
MYSGDVPLAIHLKSFFKLNKKFGGKDRKQISHLSYCYYRTGNLFKTATTEDRIVKSLFLCSNESNAILEQLNTEYNAVAKNSLQEKLTLLNVPDDIAKIFPLAAQLSDGLDGEAFIANQLQQPFLFIRMRPQYLSKILLKLKTIAVEYKIIDPYTIQLPNSFKVEEHFEVNKEVIIQDYSSQIVFNDLLLHINTKNYYKVWDACAASGGKSILIHDLLNRKLDLFVTDIRTTILNNLEERFKTALIKNYKIAEVNLSKKGLGTQDKFDIVICDAPCSGSGTWSRTPEQLATFRTKQLEEYSTLQKSIALHIIPQIQMNGYLVYITCSVFAQENERVVEHILSKSSLQLLSATIIKGYLYQADSMFVAVFKNGEMQM